MPDRAGPSSPAGRDRGLLARKLGPMPAASLRAMRDYGLADAEIARYYGMTPASVARCRRLFCAGAPEGRRDTPRIPPPQGSGGAFDRG
ncbi:hypothetical protein [Rhodosalinus sp. K401]|uniref:hypothetical protein n=1 Tax=Rhodosalinus sp. K401 TaxID=3239195 RepID=UPI0035263C13